LTLGTRRKAFNRLVTSIIGITMSVNRLPLKEPATKQFRRTCLKIHRTRAFQKQHGRCYYCYQPMWNESEQELTTRFSVSPNQAKLLKYTGEHLVAHSEGGSSGHSNIVAACWFCNTRRHRRKKIPSPANYRELVIRKLSRGAWHRLRLGG
jgi:hypothetical protein